MVTSISTTYCADKARVYVHGMSGGAYFTNQLGRWRSSAIRAIAPQSGGGPKSTPGQAATTPSPCQKQNGTVDQVVFCAIPGLNHAIWSGAPAAIWQFFAAN